MNRIKQPGDTIPAPAPAPKKSAVADSSRRFIDAINIFGYFEQGGIVRIMPYIFFLTLLALIYIGNIYYAERTIRDMDRTERELKELRSEFITGKSELMYRSKLSEVAVAIEPHSLKESVVPPKKIIVRNKNQVAAN
jgi:hypothetical protein